MLGRGVPLIQCTGNSYKVDKVAAHRLAQSVSESARTACDSFQLGNGIQGGIAIGYKCKIRYTQIRLQQCL